MTKEGRRDRKFVLISVILGIYKSTVTNFTFKSRVLHFWQDFRDYVLGLFKLFAFFFDDGIDILDIHDLCDREESLLFGFIV